jgi:hypothetical protein
MKAAGHYIGTPNGIVLCISHKDGEIVRGCLYHGYSREGIPFYGYEEVIKIAEQFFNALGFPHMGTGDRDISGRTYRCQKRVTCDVYKHRLVTFYFPFRIALNSSRCSSVNSTS